MRVGVCVSGHSAAGLSLSDCSLNKKKYSLICGATTSCANLFFFLVLVKRAWTSEEANYDDCRHVSEDEKNHENLVESDHVHDDSADDCCASGSEDWLVKFSRLHWILRLC